MSKLDEAIQTAAKLHAGQIRDGEHALPYFVHPIEVLLNLRNVGGIYDEDMLIAAVLHDTVEEAGGDLNKLEKQFGKRAAALVRELTREEPTKKETEELTREEVWQLRSSMLLEEIANMSVEAQTIKLADRLCNVREALRTRVGEKLDRYLVQTYAILETIPRELNPPLWDAVAAELKIQEV
jgi:guanosine-3',5'-bis(diphosphate) 3'-pyrophosphohydrolase